MECPKRISLAWPGSKRQQEVPDIGDKRYTEGNQRMANNRQTMKEIL
jgi:hypothetical protein